jgi:methyl-accepting chemotaxis protein PixJ
MTTYPSTSTGSLQAPRQTLKERLRINSIGSRLFLSIMTGAVVGLGLTATLFYQVLEQRSTAQVRGILNNEVTSIEKELEGFQYYSKGLARAVEFAKEQNVSSQADYDKLVLSFFDKRPRMAISTYLAQTPYGVLPNTKWYFPYIFQDQKVPEQVGKRLPYPHNDVIYTELFRDDNYPEKDYFKTPAAAQKDTLWTEPYAWYGITLSSFYTPIRNSQGKIIAYGGMDVSVNLLTKEMSKPVLEKAGYFSILSSQGNLLAYPPEPKKAKAVESYQSIPAFKKNWKQFTSSKAGFVRDGGNYWFYQRIPSNNWLMIAVVPESVIVGPILRLTVLGVLGVAVVLAIVVVLFVQRLNRGLKPILDECNKLAASDALSEEVLSQQDEVTQLSTSFFNLLDKLRQNEDTIRQESAMRLAMEEQQRQAVESESTLLQGDIEKLLDAVSAVEQGNLTVQAPVSDRVTGLVSDTFNCLVEELAAVIAQVLSAAKNVSQNTRTLEAIAGTVANNAGQQADAVSEALHLSGQVEDSATATVEKLQRSNTNLLELLQTVQEGQEAIKRLTQGTTTLQIGTDQIIQQMKTLGEFVGLAEQFVQDQNQIATQTQILALNASLVAARAAEQKDPRKFAIAAQEFESIADQVSQLAQQTNEGLTQLEQRTNQIQSVVASVDAEVQGLGGLVSGFTQGVAQSNSAFNSVQTVTTSVVQTGEQVTHASQNIINRAKSTASAMKAIVHLAQKTADLTLDARQQSESMGQLSTQLLQRVEFFKLPTADASKSTAN